MEAKVRIIDIYGVITFHSFERSRVVNKVSNCSKPQVFMPIWTSFFASVGCVRFESSVLLAQLLLAAALVLRHRRLQVISWERVLSTPPLASLALYIYFFLWQCIRTTALSTKWLVRRGHCRKPCKLALMAVYAFPLNTTLKLPKGSRPLFKHYLRVLLF